MAFFGFSLGSKKNNDSKEQYRTFTEPNNNDGAVNIDGDLDAMGGAISYTQQLETNYKDQTELINKYREIAGASEVDNAIDNIINEAIVFEPDKKAVEVNLDDAEDFSDNIKNKIRDEFDTILQLLDFNFEGDDIFKRWYIDGQINYHLVVDNPEKPKELKDIRFIDPRKLQKVREVVKEQDKKSQDPAIRIVGETKEYFIYKEKSDGTSHKQNALKIHPDSIARSISGITEQDTGFVYSYLHKALKPFNQLSMLEDSVVIYRLTRAPERRAFYIDTGKLPKSKADQYLRSLMQKFRNKMVYDAKSGSVQDSTRNMSMQEDFWLPRPEGAKGTEIQSLQSGQNLGELTDVQYFKKKLYSALKIPPTRFSEEGGGGFNLGRASEISRDEVLFQKFVMKLRKQFSMIFFQALKTQLILKKIITEEDWQKLKEQISFEFNTDSYFAELKQGEIIQERLDKLRDAMDNVGTLYSQEWVQKNILRMTDAEIEDEKKKIEEEKKQGLHQSDDVGF